MGNELLNPVKILKETEVRLENVLVLFKAVNREFDHNFAVPDDKAGATVNARIPVRFVGRTGDELQPEDIVEKMVPISINRLWGQDMGISDQELTLTIDRFGERYIDPATDSIANRMECEGFDLYKKVANISDTAVPGVTPTARTTYTGAKVALANSGCPLGKEFPILVSPEMEQYAIEFGALQYNPSKTIGDQYLKGTMGRALGLNWSMAQNVARHQVGLCGSQQGQPSAPVVATGNQSGSTINLSGFPASTKVLNEGDIVKFTGSNGVNPLSWRDVGKLRSFVVTADVVSGSDGTAAVPIDPPMIGPSDPPSIDQTVTALPITNAPVFIFNSAAGAGAGQIDKISGVSSPQALVFHKFALALAIAKLELPGGLDWSEQVNNPKSGMSIRLLRGFDIQKNKRYTRMDVLGGWACPRPELACRIPG